MNRKNGKIIRKIAFEKMINQDFNHIDILKYFQKDKGEMPYLW